MKFAAGGIVPPGHELRLSTCLYDDTTRVLPVTLKSNGNATDGEPAQGPEHTGRKSGAIFYPQTPQEQADASGDPRTGPVGSIHPELAGQEGPRTVVADPTPEGFNDQLSRKIPSGEEQEAERQEQAEKDKREGKHAKKGDDDGE